DRVELLRCHRLIRGSIHEVDLLAPAEPAAPPPAMPAALEEATLPKRVSGGQSDVLDRGPPLGAVGLGAPQDQEVSEQPMLILGHRISGPGALEVERARSACPLSTERSCEPHLAQSLGA